MASSISSCRTSSVCATAVAVGLGAIALYKVYKGLSYISQPQHSQLVKLSRSKQKRAPPCESPLFKDRYFENAQGLWLYKRFWAHQGAQRVGCVFISHGYGEVSPVRQTHQRAINRLVVLTNEPHTHPFSIVDGTIMWQSSSPA